MNQNKQKNLKLLFRSPEILTFFGCWFLWFLLFSADRMGLLNYMPSVILYFLGFALLIGSMFTAFAGHEATKYLVNNAASNASKIGWLLFGVSLPLLFLAIICLIFTVSSPYEIIVYALEEEWKNFSAIEYFLTCNIFVALSFLSLNESSSVLGWVNGNLFFLFAFSFWPQNDGPAGHLCNGQFLSLDDGYESCNGVTLKRDEILNFVEYLEIQWGLDTIAHNLATFIQVCAPAILGLLVLGIVHIVWRKPYSLV